MTREFDMEHRWGARRVLEISVRLDARPHLLAFGRLRDASSSGAFIETSASLPLLTRVCVELDRSRFRHDDGRRIAGYVVRRNEVGVAVEWCEFAPMAIRALIGRDGLPCEQPSSGAHESVLVEVPPWAPCTEPQSVPRQLSAHAGG